MIERIIGEHIGNYDITVDQLSHVGVCVCVCVWCIGEMHSS